MPFYFNRPLATLNEFKSSMVLFYKECSQNVNMENSEGVAICHQGSFICFCPQADSIEIFPYPPHLYHTEEKCRGKYWCRGKYYSPNSKIFWQVPSSGLAGLCLLPQPLEWRKDKCAASCLAREVFTARNPKRSSCCRYRKLLCFPLVGLHSRKWTQTFRERFPCHAWQQVSENSMAEGPSPIGEKVIGDMSSTF